MLGAFYCPHCHSANACDCDSCREHILEGEPVAIRNEETITCPACGKDYTYGQALDTEWNLFIEPFRKKEHG